MHRISEAFENAGKMMSLIVIGVVAIDLPIIALGLIFPHSFHALHMLSPWLLFLAAVLPAAVASTNGLRVQSECARLADRSLQMERMLGVLRARADATFAEIDAAGTTAATRAGRTVDVLNLAEDCAQLTLDEVVEWSFVYAKEIVEP